MICMFRVIHYYLQNFENLKDMCIKVHGLDPAYFLSAPGSAWQSFLKKTGVKLDVDMLLMIGNGIRGGICHSMHKQNNMQKQIIKI